MYVAEWLLEVISYADLVTDLIISIDLIKSPNTGWAAITVVSMFAPFYVSSIQMIEFLRQRVITQDKEVGCWLSIISSISILPFFIFWLLFMDIFFVLISAIEPFAMFILYIVNCNKSVDSDRD